MSFGFGVGDLVAVLKVVDRLAKGTRDFQEAPTRFQDLQFTLILLRNALSDILELQAVDAIERTHLDRIQNLASHCHQPLHNFIQKLEKDDGSLGYARTSGSLKTVKARFRWSMVTNKEVIELRSALLAELIAISDILGILQIAKLRALTTEIQSQRKLIIGNHLETRLELDTINKGQAAILEVVKAAPKAIEELHSFSEKTTTLQNLQLSSVQTELQETSLKMGSLEVGVESLSRRSRRVQNQITQIFWSLCLLVLHVRLLTGNVVNLSSNIANSIASNARMFLTIHSKLTQILEATSAIPLHIDLPVIRFEDVKGQTWALPLQACSSWGSFKRVLELVVYERDPQCAELVARGWYNIRTREKLQCLGPKNWGEKIRTGMHLCQSMQLRNDAFKILGWQKVARSIISISSGGVWPEAQFKLPEGYARWRFQEWPQKLGDNGEVHFSYLLFRML
ncbi:MAG: hypothetical protein M1820_001720 [Bogoriella megaspora]|nr:MAG: hypothetical protein M1820_001720 [Bogoriella megaspora]